MPSKVFHYHLLIKEQHLDTFGHVNNATYLTLFEEARWDLITQNGYGLQKIIESGIGPTILEINLKFTKELRLRDEIIIDTQLLYYNKKVGKLVQHMTRKGETCCTGEFTISLFDLGKRKLILPTPEWLHAIGFES
jgi:acyl-CoA thioester hydrolase